MDKKIKEIGRDKITLEKDKKKAYQKPEVVTYTGDEILEILGPARACSPFPPA